MQVIDGRNATGIIDPITYMLSEGYAVLERNIHDEPVKEAYFIKEVHGFMKKIKHLILFQASPVSTARSGYF